MDILVIGYSWTGLFQRTQQIARQLAKTDRVVYWHNDRFWGQRLLKHTQGRQDERYLRPCDNLVVLSIPRLIPCRFDHALSQVSARLIQAEAQGHRAGVPRRFDVAILATYEVIDATLWKQLPARVRVYDCCDDHVHFFPPGSRRAKQVAKTEADIVQHADLVFASAPRIQQRLEAHQGQSLLVPNGADFDHFSSAQACLAPSEIADLPRPILGFIGALAPWVDIRLIAGLAQQLPDYQIVLIGPISCDTSSLSACRNVHLLGPRPYSALPGLLHCFDVAMIPFVTSELTKSVDPIKFYEYCAAGKPVVSTPIPSVVARSDVAYVAQGPMDFAQAVRQAASEDNATRRKKRLELAARNSWSARAQAIRQAVEDALR